MIDSSKDIQHIFQNNTIRLVILNNLRGIHELVRLMFTSKLVKTLIEKSLKVMTVVVDPIKINPTAMKYLSNCFRLIINTLDEEFQDYFQYLENIDQLEIKKQKHWLSQDDFMHLSNSITQNIIMTAEDMNRYRDEMVSITKLLKSFTIEMVSKEFIEELVPSQITKITCIRRAQNYYGHNQKLITNLLTTTLFSNLTEISFQSNPYTIPIDATILENLSKSGKIEKVKLFDLGNITNEDIIHLSATCKHLYIVECPKVTDEIFKYLPVLETLKIGDCAGISGIGFQYLNQSTLKSVDISIGTYLSNINIEYVKYLKEIESVTTYISTKNVIGEYLQVFTEIKFNTFVNLEPLHFSYFKKIRVLKLPTSHSVYNDQCIQILYDNLYDPKSLKHLSIEGDITDKSMVYFKYLEKLEISYCATISSEEFKYLENLKYLSISRCMNITDDAFKYLQHCKSFKIRDMKITETAYTYMTNTVRLSVDEQFPLSALKHLKNLDRFKISVNRCIDDLDPDLLKMINHLNSNGIKAILKE
ncbi:hypothetical protein DLAC_10546 [Tieghemostelium lacteum]|uniref:Uncharacterized protein n=1 Tax=Tieghemostelium lacteum TaxID=361077 RepID=A0A151Z4W4_TIELA|nr:hypothetical protein DLAC_10546 [Tieghemostelium lacteum]|eukprot:KYQ88957.1 hypothetical protein DLAC_10546 [Tieghemostelium lacteum]